MPEIRRDPLSGERVIIAEARARRPQGDQIERCPFCPGSESDTPPEIWALRPKGSLPDTPGWSIRVIPNKFPALDRAFPQFSFPSPGRKSHGAPGAHEVIIETPEHEEGLPDLDKVRLARILGVFRDRLAAHFVQPGIRYIQIFKNHGSRAGATLSHSHSQLLALPLVPDVPARRLAAARRFWRRNRRCLVCDLNIRDLESSRVVARSPGYAAVVPFAPRFPGEVRITPLQHRASLLNEDEEGLSELAALLREVLKRIRAVFDDPAYNLVFFNAPAETGSRGSGRPALSEVFHWHLEILPRVTDTAGFEWGTGMAINPGLPENWASRLAAVKID